MNIRKIKENYYNMVLKKPLKNGQNTNIQYILEFEGVYGIASIRPMTLEEINTINISEYRFKPFSEIIKGVDK